MAGLRLVYFSTHSFPTSEWTVNALGLSLRYETDRSGESIEESNCFARKFTHCLYNICDRLFLTLFYDFSSQSRYADVKELVHVKSRRPREGEYIKIDQICQRTQEQIY